MTQKEKAMRFRDLHERTETFLIPNAWDISTARILSGLGFHGRFTWAFSPGFGRRDGEISREEALDHARSIVGATDLPVSADLENGFADDSGKVAETVRLAGEAGLVGCSIEDSTGNKDKPIYDLAFSVERISAAAEAAKALPFPFTLTARAENFLHGKSDLDDTIARLLAYEKAGADVLFAPALPDLAAVRAVCSSVTKPVNFMVAIKGKSFTVDQLVEAGVRRISFASSLYRAAMTGLVEAASEVRLQGTFGYLERNTPPATLNKLLFG